MIEIAKVDSSFVQSAGSCVLASYAIANNCLASVAIEEAFQDYCRNFKIAFRDWKEAEAKYAVHFDSEWKRRKCKGYEVILCLHSGSEEKSIRIGRGVFDAIFYPDTVLKRDELENSVRSKRALLNVTYKVGPTCYHSVTVFCDGVQGLVVRNTMPGQVKLKQIPNLTSLGELQDSVLYVVK